MDKDDDARTIRVCTLCEEGYQPSKDYGKTCVCAAGRFKDTSGECSLCKKGDYCLGADDPAKSCGQGLTTLVEGATSVMQCVTLPGYAYDRQRDPNGDPIVKATRCPEGTYNAGSNQQGCKPCPSDKAGVARNSVQYQQCFEGTRTVRSLLQNDEEGEPEMPEWSCPAGQVAFGDSDICYDEWQPLKKDFDYLPVADHSNILTPVTVPLGTTVTQKWCQSNCQGSCLFYIYNQARDVPPAGRCLLYSTPKEPTPGLKVGFKVDDAVYLVVDGDEKVFSIGKEVGAPDVSSERMCSQRCDEIEGCVLFITKMGDVGGMSCSLREGALDVDYRTKYKVSKTNLVAF